MYIYIYMDTSGSMHPDLHSSLSLYICACIASVPYLHEREYLRMRTRAHNEYSLSLSPYTYTHTHTNTDRHIHVHVYTYIHKYIHTYIHAHKHTHTHAIPCACHKHKLVLSVGHPTCACKDTLVCTHVHAETCGSNLRRTRRCTCMYAHADAHACTHTQMHMHARTRRCTCMHAHLSQWPKLLDTRVMRKHVCMHAQLYVVWNVRVFMCTDVYVHKRTYKDMCVSIHMHVALNHL